MKLKNVEFDGKHAYGNIYDDEKGRFADGTYVRTSTIAEQWTDESTGKKFIKTKNNTYELEDSDDKGR